MHRKDGGYSSREWTASSYQLEASGHEEDDDDGKCREAVDREIENRKK